MTEGNIAEQQEVKYASFSGRMIASVIDNILSLIVLMPLFMFLNDVLGFTKPTLLPANPTNAELLALMQDAMPSFTFQSTIVAAIVILFWIYKSATPGKMILKMKIVDARTFGHPSKAQLIIRYLGYFVSLIPLCLGFIWIYYDKRGQGFHDKLAGTVVIKEQNAGSKRSA